ncbi:MAG: DNA alkylation repair protein [Planctomycetota bacterium]
MARRPSEVPRPVVRELNAGTREAANLAESLAVDFAALLRTVYGVSAGSITQMNAARGEGVTKRMRLASRLLLDDLGMGAISELRTHPSDTVRGWAAGIIEIAPRWSLKQRLKEIKPFADDPHYGVREWAWMAVRDAIAAELEGAIDLLTPWVSDRRVNIRRFAVEATRPRGVWCAHIPSLKDDPAPGLPLLEPLKSEPEKYAQDSVANWLNDAAKSRADWVIEVTDRWLSESDSKATARIVKRARRSL